MDQMGHIGARLIRWKSISGCAVSIDGAEAQEYGIEVSDDQKSVTCWIASELGKTEFFAGGDFCARNLPSATTFDGVTDGLSVKPFLFSSLELTDCSSHHDLGLIELVVQPVRVTRETQEIYSSPNALSEVKVHERSKKAITQQISLAEPELLAEPRRITETKATGSDLVKFSFKYRPADVLRANGIIPTPQQRKRKASAEPLRSTSPEYDQADAEREKILLEELTALKAKRLKTEKKPRVKDDPDIITHDTKTKGKKERKPVFIQGEIIDLT
ncbi:hypothetical protein C8R45DRAFT_925605 [Mycena sanguinolenta]|nr:hypothetical protein C8R45DRAFT_925605 [Mycena sanguinolenta]